MQNVNDRMRCRIDEPPVNHHRLSGASPIITGSSAPPPIRGQPVQNADQQVDLVVRVVERQ
jgi:hypothetical protein